MCCNWKFYNQFSRVIIDIGSCGLQVVRSAFQTGNRIFQWKLNDFLKAMYRWQWPSG